MNHSGFEAYLAIELDVLSKTPNMSRSSKIHEDHLLAGLVRLWAYAFREKRAELHELEVRGCFATEADVLPVLMTFGFLDRAPETRGDAFRVRGAEKYLRINAARSAGGKAAAANLKRGTQPGTSRASAGDQPGNSASTFVSDPRLLPGWTPGSPPAPPNTEHRTPNTKEEEAAPPVDRTPVVFSEPTTPASTWLGEDFFSWAQSRRQKAGLVGERRRPRNLAGWWSTCLMTPGVTAERMQAAFLAFGDSKHWQAAQPPLPFQGFMSQWDQFVPREVPRAS